ncbi:DUF192 domain-containing protein [Pseudoxanthomonas sp. UTMC 1351]|uniref:DUF192 domain-containing protein n=1 Tax=Pseudoxanthomonas sp. UTMC 1351 TaxID=2695853 RepID=UPI0034CD2323
MKAGALYRGDDCVVARVWRADNAFTRLRGLLARPALAAGEGLLLIPCGSVHTLGMGYALDLVFLSKQGEVLGWRAGVRPWRTAGHRGAYATLELAVGGLEALLPVRGELLLWRPAPADIASANGMSVDSMPLGSRLPQGQRRTS